MSPDLPLIIEPDSLNAIIDNDELLIIDLCDPQQFQQAHLPHAIYVSPGELVAGTPPAPGKLPDINRLNQLFSRIGLSADKTVVAYDDEGGGWAGRLLWTLEVIGHKHYAYLNGGIHAWHQAGLPLTAEAQQPTPTTCNVSIDNSQLLTKEQILENLENPDFLIWDARSRDEYLGNRQTAAKNGHIPGAVHCEWTELMDRDNGLRIRKDAKEYLTQKGITPEKFMTTHCQTHHRSGFTWLVGKMLGFNIVPYPGSWSEWGNDPATPVEK